MDKRYSQMTEEELRNEIADLKVKAQKAEQMGMVNEYAVHERKMMMAQAYMMDPSAFNSGETYEIIGSRDTFKISYMNGVFAWGNRNNSQEEEALPISVLGNIIVI
ncbi:MULTISPECIES: YfhH family protein [Bacillaceae]|uniref:YfhH family protein n=1 Tax=Evansella alkalicola TaxID=745819 RepID=A0ABS6JMS6_9BACI|nr:MULTISPECIES: YfhH family protein [Bacillaceae]MBU9719861.1 YfhH family protein [Bacillus alkalicola]